MQIKLLVEGGAMKPGPTLSQKLGPIGINVNQVIQRVNEATKDFGGLKVPIELEVNSNFEVRVFSPPVSELLKKEAGIAKGSGIQKKMQVANISIEQIISIAKAKFQNLLCKDLKLAVKTVVGSCVSLGILIENKLASEIEKEIDSGKYDKEISQEKTETSVLKKTELKKYFTELKAKQDKLLEQEKAAKESELKAKEAESLEGAAENLKVTKPEEPKKK